MTFRVTGAYEDRVQFEFSLPYTEDGEPAYTSTGEPVKGKTPTVMRLPLYQYMDDQQVKDLVKTAEDIEKRELSDDYTVFERQKDNHLESMRLFVTDQHYKLLTKLTIGELAEINAEWSRLSALPVGELLASNGSSKNTRRPSNTISTTSAAAGAAT